MTTKIFFDMDGVLVDFARGAVDTINDLMATGDDSKKAIRRLINYDGPDKEPITVEFLENATMKKDAKLQRTQWEKRVSDAMFSVVGTGGHEYWANLPPLPNFQSMIDAAIELVGSENVYVCTAPVGDNNGCESGKRAWVAGNTNISADNVFVTEDKGSIAQQFPEDACILIDDRKKYVDAWKAAGGIPIRHTPGDSQSSISQLNLLVNSHKYEYSINTEEL